MRISLTALTGHGPLDILATGDDSITVARLAESLEESVRTGAGLAPVVPHPRWGGAPRRTELWANGRPLPPEAPAVQVLRDGDMIAFSPQAAAATVRGEPAGVAELRVSSGPSSGAVHRLGFGAATIGSGREATVPLDDPATAPFAATVQVTTGEVTVAPAAGAHVTLDGVALAGPAPWPPGGVLVTGASVLTLAFPQAPDAHLTPMPDGGLAYNRPPRLTGPPRTRTIEVPVEPKQQEGQRLQILASLLFAVGGVVLAIVFQQMLFLLMALLTPITMVAQWWSDRRYGRKRHRQAMKDYRRRREEFGQALERLRRADQADRRAEFPDPAEALLTCTGPRGRLWERRIHDADTLDLRLGVADRPAAIELVPEHGSYGVDAKALPPVPLSHAVPVSVPLPRVGVLGLTGARPSSRALARWLVAQAATLHSPRDLAIVVLSADAEAAVSWNWVRWLPHCAPREGEECVALVGTDPESAARRVSELVAKINERRPAPGAAAGLGTSPFGGGGGVAEGYAVERPYNVLLVLDGARALRGLPGMPQVLQQGPAVGVYSICVDDDQRLLPEECTSVAVSDWERPAYVRLRGGAADTDADIVADQVTIAWCDRLARAMAPVRDVSRDDADAAIPSSARLLDLLGMPDPRPDQIEAYWRRGRTTRVPVGIGADGPFAIDLRLDGPHGLIAGTTGAGKSELLQSLIASLAVANRPDEMTFVLIDYKGGSAFKDCARLPHTVGMVSDLDGHLTERALQSLAAELRRREHLLLDADAKDIEDYNELRDTGTVLPSMPRLLLVIDEFAAMVQELPDFVVGLVDIARRGRSLGVHLLLATQRPAGVVTPDIAANTNLRISLRVTSSGESTDVINTPVAATISKTTPGRCYVRSGAAAPAPVQSARIGGRRPGDGSRRPASVRVVPLGWRGLGTPLPAAPDEDGDESTMVTDLAVLVETIAATAQALGVAEQPSPWLPPLPDQVTLDELPAREWTRLPLGLADIPSLQRREVETYDLAAAGHLLVCGAGRSGRSTVLRAVGGAAGRYTDPRDVHLYAVDCGNNALLPLVGLPHTGAVVGRDSPDRLGRLTDRLLTEIARRQQSLAAQGFADVSEQRAAVPADRRLPYILVLFDRWEGFVAAFESYDGGRLIDQWLQILQEGSGAGVKVVMSGDRSTLVGRISTLFDDRLVLKLTDPGDYTYIGMKTQDVPEHLPPGRGFRAGTGLRETQVALLAEDAAGTAQVAALHQIARDARARAGDLPRAARPFRVDALPPVVDLAETLALAEDPLPADAVVFGVGGDSLGVRYFRAEEHGPALVIAGPPKTGRSTALCTMLAGLLDRSYEAVLISPRRGPLRDMGDRPGVRGSFTAESEVDEVKKAIAACSGRYALIIDDLELLGNDGDLAEWVTEHVGELRDTGNLVIAAGSVEDLDSMYRGPVVAMKKSRNGLLLRPAQPGDGDLFGVRLPRSVASGSGPVGRGLLVLAGMWEQVQVAHPG
ncbi:cell division protein FtsK [Sphaerisporangium rufum]|uniref:Cell division protein FtsK n=1 Tax=Sphaerisporangium rufum TaxID=1381558 RepID=A0A919QZ75_9ACTN|nr:FtsK/SpoIIIE domain-containing protein [Sphaerisporangium rufum]GII75520.1 cell division protein FtsK [Sphaerisporangium rufum]